MKIPVFDTPDVASQAIGTPQTSVDPSPLAQAGQGLQALGQDVSQVVGQATQLFATLKGKADEAATADLQTKLVSATNPKLYDPNTGLMFKRGDQLFPDSPEGKQDLGQKTFEDIVKARDEVAAGASNGAQREAFTRWSNNYLQTKHVEIEHHVAQQTQVAREASLRGLQATSLDDLANNYADPASRAEAIARPEGMIASNALSKEDKAASLAEWRQKANATVLNQYIANRDWQGAQGYFAQVKDQLGASSAQFTHTIATLKEQTTSDQTALGLINAARQPNGFLNDAAVTSGLEAVPPGPEKRAVEEQVSKYLSLEKMKESNVKAQNFNVALSAFEGRHSLTDVPAPVKAWITQNDPERWNQLENIAASWGKKDDKTDTVKAANFISILTGLDKNPLKFKGMDVAQFNATIADQVSNADFKKLGERFSKIQSMPDWKLPGTANTVTEVFQHAFSEKKTDPKAWTPEHQELWRDVHDYVEKQANEYIRAHNGNPPASKELEGWANDRLMKGSVVGGGIFSNRVFSTDRTGVSRVEAEHDKDYKGKVFKADIPDDRREKIVDSLKKAGNAKPTEEDIRATFDDENAAAREQ